MVIHWREMRQERCACPASQTTTPLTRPLQHPRGQGGQCCGISARGHNLPSGSIIQGWPPFCSFPEALPICFACPRECDAGPLSRYACMAYIAPTHPAHLLMVSGGHSLTVDHSLTPWDVLTDCQTTHRALRPTQQRSHHQTANCVKNPNTRACLTRWPAWQAQAAYSPEGTCASTNGQH
jgi:hypothetical protein